MELTKKERTIKYGLYAALVLLAALLQNVLSSAFAVGSAHCFILLPVAVMVGLNEDEKAAALYGLLGGAVLDITSAQTRGFNAIFLMLACYAASVLVTFFFRSTFHYTMAAVVLTAVLYCLCYWLLFVVFKSADGAGTVLVRFYLPCAVYTAAVAPLLYLLLKPLQNKLNKIETIQE